MPKLGRLPRGDIHRADRSPFENDRLTMPIQRGRQDRNRDLARRRTAPTASTRPLGQAISPTPTKRRSMRDNGDDPQVQVFHRWRDDQIDSVLNSQHPTGPTDAREFPRWRRHERRPFPPPQTALATAQSAAIGLCPVRRCGPSIRGRDGWAFTVAAASVSRWRCLGIPSGSQRSCRSLPPFRPCGSRGTLLGGRGAPGKSSDILSVDSMPFQALCPDLKSPEPRGRLKPPGSAMRCPS